MLPSRKAIPRMDTDITQNCIIHGGPTHSALEVELGSPLCTECAHHVSQLQAPLVSPFEHLLSDTVRHVPSNSEELQIRDIIRDADHKIAEIDSTSQRIRLVLDHLDRERRAIQEFAAKHRVMVAPVWELPPEILSYIFLLSLPVRLDWAEIKRSSLKRSITLSRVNRHWRNVAISTPRLWTTIHIDGKSFSKTYDDSEETCIPKLFLQRSGMCPLSLSVHTTDFNEAIIATLLPLAERWHRITLDTTRSMLAALSPVYNRLPLLRTLEFKHSHWAGSNDTNHFTFFSKAPLLRHLTSSCPYFDDFNALPLHQLTRWDSPTPVLSMPKIFALTPNLEECFLQPLRLIPNTVIPQNETAVAYKLTSLHISSEVASGGTQFQLQHLPQFPSLRRLFLFFDRRAFFSASSILPLFVKSGGQLEYLVWGFGAALTTINDCLKHTPILTTLHFHRITSDKILSRLIAPNSDGEVLVPNLGTLLLSGKTSFSASSLIDVIRSRWENPKEVEPSEPLAITVPGHPRNLKSVLILQSAAERFESHRKKQLLALNGEGFDVHVHVLDRKALLSRNNFPTPGGEPFFTEVFFHANLLSR